MNANIVVGVGNIYANEALYLAGIHPKRRSDRIAVHRMPRLVDAIKTVLTRAIDAGGTTLRDFHGGDGEPGYFKQELNVYARDGQPCPACKRPLSAIVLGQRSKGNSKSDHSDLLSLWPKLVTTFGLDAKRTHAPIKGGTADT